MFFYVRREALWVTSPTCSRQHDSDWKAALIKQVCRTWMCQSLLDINGKKRQAHCWHDVKKKGRRQEYLQQRRRSVIAAEVHCLSVCYVTSSISVYLFVCADKPSVGVRACVWVGECECKSLCLCLCAHARACMCVCVCVLCVCVCVCVCVYTHMYMLVYAHTCSCT